MDVPEAIEMTDEERDAFLGTGGVGVVSFANDAGRTVAVLLHHTSHPTHGFGGNLISAGKRLALSSSLSQKARKNGIIAA